MLVTIGLFFVAILLSFVFSIDRSITIRKLWNVAQYAVGFGVMLYMWREFGRSLLQRSVWALLYAGLGLSLYSLTLFYLQWPLGDAWDMRNWLINHTVEILHGVRTFKVFASGDNNWILINGPLRAVGTFPTPMGLGQYLFVSLFLAITLIITAPTSLYVFTRKTPKSNPNPPVDSLLSVKNRTELMFCYLVLGLDLITEIATYSRGAWFGTILGLVVAVGLSLLLKSQPGNANPKPLVTNRWQRNLKKLAAPLLIILIITVVAYLVQGKLPLPYPKDKTVQNSSYGDNQTSIDQRMKDTFEADNESNQVRFTVWKYAIDLFEQHPIFGRGLGTFAVGDSTEIASQPKDLQSALYSSTYAHNIYLDFLAETGLVGLLGYLLLIWATVYYAWQLWRQAQRDWQLVAIAVLAITAAAALHNMFDDMFPVPKNGLTLFMLVALVFAGKLLKTAPTPETEKALAAKSQTRTSEVTFSPN
jgi:O-antigen ligase